MIKFSFSLLFATLLFSATCPAVSPAPSPLAQVKKEVLDQVDKISKDVTIPGKVSTRSISGAAYAILITGGPAARAESLLRLVFDDQEMDPNSPDYGTLHWVLNSEAIKDANAIDFGTQAWGPIFLDHAGQLSAAFKDEAKSHIAAALVALQRHHVDVSYTNIFLMNTVNTLLLSEVADDSTQHERALNQLDAWIAYTQQNGIHEFDSPTYYAVDLDSLLSAYNHEKNPGLHAKFGRILDYLWQDIATNHNPAVPRSLVGAHSRDYSFLRGAGPLDNYLYLNGVLKRTAVGAPDILHVFMLDNALSHGYHPPSNVTDLSRAGERTILQRFDANPEHVRTTYITPQYAIGTAPNGYCAQDKMFAADFATSKDLPSVTVVPDILDAPYGLIKTKDTNGHDKTHHEPINLACVQNKGDAILLVNLDLTHDQNAASLATNVILPAQADATYVDGKRVDVSKPFEQPLTPESIISVHENHACLTARFFQVDSLNAAAPQFELRAEPAGLKEGAARWVVYHARKIDPAVKMPDQLRVGLIIEMSPWKGEAALKAAGQELKALPIDQQSDANLWQVTATLGGRKLAVAEDLTKHVQAYARIDDQPAIAPDPLVINGKNIPLVP